LALHIFSKRGVKDKGSDATPLSTALVDAIELLPIPEREDAFQDLCESLSRRSDLKELEIR
jgi:hypothetical protein